MCRSADCSGGACSGAADPQVVAKPNVPETSITVEQDQEEAEGIAIIMEDDERLLVGIERDGD